MRRVLQREKRPAYREQRRCERHAIFVECRLEGSSSRASARLTDLSAAGCYVDTRMPVNTGARMAIHVTLNGEDTVLTGTIGRAHPGHGFVLEFDALSDAARRYLVRLRTITARSNEPKRG
jgi:hypothetical protein